MTDKKALGRRLADAREAAGLTQAQAAEALGLKTPVRVSEYERGKHTPGAGILSAMAELYHVSERDLMRGATVSRETVNRHDRVSEPPPDPYGDPFVASADLRRGVDERVIAVADGYLARLGLEGAPEEFLTEAERHLLDPRYAKLNRKGRGDFTPQELIQIMEVTFELLSDALTAARSGQR